MTLPSPVRNEHCYVFVSSLSKPIHSELDAAARKRRSVPMAATINNSARKNSNRLLHLRMRRGNACGRVCVCVCVSVSLSVCPVLVSTLTQKLHFWFASGYIQVNFVYQGRVKVTAAKSLSVCPVQALTFECFNPQAPFWYAPHTSSEYLGEGRVSRS